MQNGQPRFAGRVEALGCDLAQCACGCSSPIRSIHRKQHSDRRLIGVDSRSDTSPPQSVVERRTDCRGPARTDAGRLLQPPVMRRRFQLLQGLGFKLFMQSRRQFRAYPRDGPEQTLGFEHAGQTVELRPSAGGEYLGNGRGDTLSDARKRNEAYAPFLANIASTPCPRPSITAAARW